MEQIETTVSRRTGPCRHCDRPVVHDPDGRPIHTSREYACRDVWGMLAVTPTVTHADPVPPVRRATNRVLGRGTVQL